MKENSILKQTSISNISLAPSSVSLEPSPQQDALIQVRLRSLISIAEELQGLEVQVSQGIIIIKGPTPDPSNLEWFENAALKLDGVLAFVDKTNTSGNQAIDLEATTEEVVSIQKKIKKSLPYVASSLIVIGLTIILAFIISWLARRFLFYKIDNVFLRKTAVRIFLIPFVAIGLYLAFNLSGLSHLAATVLGGTGLIGLGLGLALKNVFENYFSSMISEFKKAI